jgi:hypothetical protein
MASRPPLISAYSISDSLSLRYTFPPTVATNNMKMSELTERIAQLIPVDVTLLLILCFLCIAFTLYAIRRLYRHYFPGPLTHLFLQIGDLQSSMMIPWGYFVHPVDFYSFSVQPSDSEEAHLVATPYCLGLHILKVSGIRTIATHKYLNLNQDIASKQLISYFSASKIKQLMTKEHFLAFLIKDADGKITSCIKLRSFNSSLKPNFVTQSAPSMAAIYPSLNILQSEP